MDPEQEVQLEGDHRTVVTRRGIRQAGQHGVNTLREVDHQEEDTQEA